MLSSLFVTWVVVQPKTAFHSILDSVGWMLLFSISRSWRTLLLFSLEPISTKHLGLCKWFSSMKGVDWLADSSSSCWRLWHFPVILKVFLCLSHALMHSCYRSNYSDAPKCVPRYPTRWFSGIIMKTAASVGPQEVFDFLPTSHIWEAYLPPGDASLRRESQVPRKEKSVNVWWHSGHSSDWGW